MTRAPGDGGCWKKSGRWEVAVRHARAGGGTARIVPVCPRWCGRLGFWSVQCDGVDLTRSLGSKDYKNWRNRNSDICIYGIPGF